MNIKPISRILKRTRRWLLPLWLLAVPVAAHSEQVTLALENAEIIDLINWASDYLDKTIIIHPGVQGRVSVLSGQPISRDEAYQVFLSVLQVHGFTVVEEENALKVVPRDVAKQTGTPLVAEQAEVSIEDLVVRIVRLDHADATSLIPLLQPFVSQFGHVAGYARTNSLIIADRAGNIAEMVKIIKEFDLGRIHEIEMIPLEFASITDVVDVVNKLIQGQGEDRQLAFATDKRTNSILITGGVLVRRQVRELVKRLDQPLPSGGDTQVIEVNYLKAGELAPILIGLQATHGQQAGEGQPFERTSVNIQVSEATNSLIVTAPPELMKTMRGIISKLDVRRRQVLVEAIIVEVNADLNSDLGIEWRSADPGDDGIFSGFSAIPGALPGGVPSADDPALGSGLTLGFLHNTTLRALIRALQSNVNANILSTPNVVTLDNKEAEILVGSNIPFITGSATGAASSTANPFQTIERQDIGITLNVKPRINAQDSIILEIEQTVESISTAAVATADIITNKRNIKTSVRLDNEQVLVLGGLISDEAKQNERKVPLLGDLPVLGRLFKSTSVKSKKTNLLVFIHPIILTDRERARELSAGRYNQLRDIQRRYNEGTMDSIFLHRELPELPRLSELPGYRNTVSGPSGPEGSDTEDNLTTD